MRPLPILIMIQEVCMKIAKCRSYHAICTGTNLLRMPDGKSAFKIYYLSIVGRDKPELYQWDRCGLDKEDFENRFTSGEHAGIGFVTAFPHVTKVFRFAPHMETVLDVKAFDTSSMKPCDCARDEGYYEFACYAEALIAAEEYRAWATSSSVADYLTFLCRTRDFPVEMSSKLGVYWAS